MVELCCPTSLDILGLEFKMIRYSYVFYVNYYLLILIFDIEFIIE